MWRRKTREAEITVSSNVSNSGFPEFETFITHVSHSLNYLNVTSSLIGREAGVLGTILTHCVNLEHLILANLMLSDGHVEQLLETLNGSLRNQLLSLDLSWNAFRGDEICEKFAEFLAPDSGSRSPSLRELRLFNRHIIPVAFAVFNDALLVNKTLRFLELVTPRRSQLDEETYRTVQAGHLRM